MSPGATISAPIPPRPCGSQTQYAPSIRLSAIQVYLAAGRGVITRRVYRNAFKAKRPDRRQLDHCTRRYVPIDATSRSRPPSRSAGGSGWLVFATCFRTRPRKTTAGGGDRSQRPPARLRWDERCPQHHRAGAGHVAASGAAQPLPADDAPVAESDRMEEAKADVVCRGLGSNYNHQDAT